MQGFVARVQEPKMHLRTAIAGLGVGVAGVALLAAVTPARSSTVLAGFEPWQESPWSGRATQGLDAQGQDWCVPGREWSENCCCARRARRRHVPGHVCPLDPDAAHARAARVYCFPACRFDQPGSFVGNGYAGAVAEKGRPMPGMMLAEDAAFQPWAETPWSGRATQGLDAQGQDW